MNNLSIPRNSKASEEEIRSLLLRYRCENWDGIQPAEIQEAIVESFISGDWTEPLKRVAPYIALSEKCRVLDLGCGVGSFVVACRKRGLECFGVEPDRIGNGISLSAIQIARRRWEEPIFFAGTGENLPLCDRSFDLVVLNQVIEHVTDQTAVISEAARVLRSGGVIYLACPNYLRFYEPHYKIFWLPLMPKALGRLYLRLRGRTSVMLDQINYTTNRRVRSLLSGLGPEYTALDLHREQFLAKRDLCAFSSRYVLFVSKLTRFPVIGPFLLALVLWFGAIREGGCEWIVIRSNSAAT
jgi:SAM-dependent methyltransferase